MASTNKRSDEDLPGRKTILVVEDDEDIGNFLVMALTAGTPYHVLLATDGIQALERAATLIPHLFVIDYQLPQMNGIELYERLHERDAFQHVPVLFMSANTAVREMEKQPGVYAIAKPFDLEELEKTIQHILNES